MTIPFFLFMAALSFRAGKKAPKRGRLISGRVNANPRSKGWIPGVLGFIGGEVASEPSQKTEGEYYFDLNGDPYPVARSNRYIDAQNIW